MTRESVLIAGEMRCGTRGLTVLYKMNGQDAMGNTSQGVAAQVRLSLMMQRVGDGAEIIP